MPKPVDLDLPETEVAPDPKLEKRTRRSFSTEYKLRIIAEADQCQHGELEALLRRESLYSNQLQAWWRQWAGGGEQALSKTAPGPKPKFSAEQREIEKLSRENARLKKELHIANKLPRAPKSISNARSTPEWRRRMNLLMADRDPDISLARACDAQNPWRRGSNENTNALLRQYSPKSTDLSVRSRAKLNAVARQLN